MNPPLKILNGSMATSFLKETYPPRGLCKSAKFQQAYLACPSLKFGNRAGKSLVKLHASSDDPNISNDKELPENIAKFINKKFKENKDLQTQEQIEALANKLSPVLTTVIGILGLYFAQSSQTSSLSDKISALSDRVNDKFGEVSNKFSEVNDKFGEVNNKFSEVNNKFSDLKDILNQEKLDRSLENRKLMEALDKIQNKRFF